MKPSFEWNLFWQVDPRTLTIRTNLGTLATVTDKFSDVIPLGRRYGWNGLYVAEWRSDRLVSAALYPYQKRKIKIKAGELPLALVVEDWRKKSTAT